jgi:tetratricopeptide (TPR) repeat protein
MADEPGSTTPDDLIRRAEESLRNGDASAARDQFQAALVERPDDPRALLGLGRALTERRRYNEADALYRDMETRHIEAIEARLGRARLRSLQGDHEGARRFYRDALQADPGNLEARLGLAREAHAQGLDRTALAQADNLVLDHPESEAARALQREIHDGLRPHVTLEPLATSDDGDNRTRQIRAAGVFMAEPQSAVEIAYTAHEAELDDDSVRSSILTGGVMSRLLSPLSFLARAGFIRQTPLDEEDRVLLFGDGNIRWVVGPRFTIRAFASRRPILDSVPLVDWGIRVDSGEMRLEYRYRPEWMLVADGELGRYSDGNARETASAFLAWEPQGSRPRVTTTVGARLRRFNDDRDYGYLDPIHYDSQSLTVRLWDEEMGDRLVWHIEGTLGRQSYDPNDAQRALVAEPEERLHGGEAALGVAIGERVRLEAFHQRTNDALESAPGFGIRRSGLSLRVRL